MGSIQAQNVNHPDHRQSLDEKKYNLIREAMLASLPAPESGESVPFSALETSVRTYLEEQNAPLDLFPKLGSVRWYTKTVQLDLEARGEIERVPDQSPIRLRKC